MLEEKVRVSLGQTVNIGNYESVRVDVTLELPCDELTRDSAFEKVKKWVMDKLSREVEAVRGRARL